MTKAELEKRVEKLDLDQLETIRLLSRLMDMTSSLMKGVNRMAQSIIDRDKEHITH